MFNVSSSIISFYRWHLLDVASMMGDECSTTVSKGTGLQTAAKLCPNTAAVWVSAMTALCPVLHRQNFLQSPPLSYTDGDGPAVPARPLCSTRLWAKAAHWPCFPLLPDGMLISPLQRQRITEEQCRERDYFVLGQRVLWEWEKQTQLLCSQTSVEGQRPVGTAVLPPSPVASDWQGSCLKPYWSLVQKVQECQECCNTFSSFWIEVMKEWNAFLLWEES